MELWLNCNGFPPVRLGGRPVLIGRSSECDLRLPHESVSRRHATIGPVGTKVMLHNRSPLGVEINREETTRPTELTPGDQITIGPYVLRVDEAPVNEADAELEPTVPICLGQLQDLDMKGKLAELEKQKKELERQVFDSQRALARETRRGRSAKAQLKQVQAELDGFKRKQGGKLPTRRERQPQRAGSLAPRRQAAPPRPTQPLRRSGPSPQRAEQVGQ